MNARKVAPSAALVAAIIAAVAQFAPPFEGTVTVARPDPVGIPTDCNGHTKGVHNGDRPTSSQCHAYLLSDIADAYNGIAPCIQWDATLGQWVALTDMAFNMGPSTVCRSSVVKLANAGASPAIWCPRIGRYVYAGGRILPGLVRRRKAEVALCLKDSP
jgi:lysozyme